MKCSPVPFFQLALPARFQVIRRIGAGGMGVVYEARDLERDERVALKTLLHHDADTMARIKHEFRALQDIHHPNLVNLRELVADAHDAFFTMDLIDGVDLLTWVRGEAPPAPATSAPTAVDLRPALSTDTDVDVAAADDEPTSQVQSRGPFEPREAAKFDEARLRDALRQISLGLSALHAAGRVHRDVKPSNVRVTTEGRVVLLDFGVVSQLDAREHTEGAVVGTPLYMAPEQASSQGVGPPADWYAVGVMLYECLTGRRPFEGASTHVLYAKHYQEPLPPGAFVADVPADLEALCLELLRVEPRARPTGQELLRRLQAQSSDRPASAGAPFVGRDAELAALERAFGDAGSNRRAVTVALYGESGVGKSCLVRRFLDVALAGRDDVLVLAGRCYEREAVPYKALDEVIELLSRRLARLPRSEALDLLPPGGADSLSLLFPAMGRVPAIGSRASMPDRDPLERRRAAFHALRGLFAKLCARQRVVVTIDDLQWTDADSLALLQELLRPPDAPALMLVATMRGGPQADAAPPTLVASLPGDVRPVHVGRLAGGDARRLAELLLAHSTGVGWSSAAAIASEAGGHPLFIDELVRHASLSQTPANGSLRLDEALWRRVLRLDAGARRVLEVACLLGAPVTQDVIAHAAQIEMSELTRAVALLRATNFVRTHGARVSDAIEPFHDRVREAIVARLDEAARRDRHANIAGALEVAKGSDPEVLATHWEGAGEPVKAARYVLVAAEQAAQALAFDRAARLYRRGLELLPASDPRRRGVREQLAGALANAGDGVGAATEFERAADGAGPREALELHRRAAEQLLRAGHLARGLQLTRTVLAALGMSWPRTTLGALVALLWYRLVLRVRGLGFEPRQAAEVDADVLKRIDVCASLSFTIPYADVLTGALFHARHVLMALRAGEPKRAARALSMEAAYRSSSGGVRGWPRVERTIALAHAAAERTGGDPYTRAIVLGNDGLARCVSLRFGEAIEPLERSVQMLRAEVPGTTYEINTAYYFLFMSLEYACRFEGLRERIERALAEATERGDLYAAVMLRVGALNSVWLYSGDPARARRELEIAERSLPEGPIAAQHPAVIARGYIDLYDDEPERAYAQLHAVLPRLRRSIVFRVIEGYRLEMESLRARIALMCAARQTGARREALVREAERANATYRRLPDGPILRINVLLVRASAAALRGRAAGARAALEELARDDGAEETWIVRQCARWVLGRLDGDEAAVGAAARELSSRGVAPDPRLVAVWLPGFNDVV